MCNLLASYIIIIDMHARFLTMTLDTAPHFSSTTTVSLPSKNNQHGSESHQKVSNRHHGTVSLGLDCEQLTIRRGVGTRGIDEATVLNGYTLVAPLTSKKVSMEDIVSTDS